MLTQTEAYLIDVGGGITAHVPLARRLSHRDTADLEFAMVVCSEGFGDFGAGLVERIEARFGVNDHHRVAAALPADTIVGAFVPLAGAHDKLARLRDRIVSRTKPAPVVDQKVRDAEALTNYYIGLFDEAVAAIAEAQKIMAPSRRAEAIADAADAKIAAEEALDRHLEKQEVAARRAEIETLEALRGGSVVTRERVIETPETHDGRFVWERGRQVMRTETVTQQTITTRDGLDTLATSHLDANGRPRVVRGVYLLPAIDNIQLAALTKYREIYEKSDPERSLGAIDLAAVRGGRTAGDPFEQGGKLQSARIKRIQRGEAVVRLEELVWKGVDTEHGHKRADLAVRALRNVAGRGDTVRSLVGDGGPNTRMVAALVAAADILAEHFGLI